MSHQGGSSGSPYNSHNQDGRYFPAIQPPIPTPQVSPIKQPPMIPMDPRHPARGGSGVASITSSQASDRSPSADRSSRGIGVHALIHHQPNEPQEPRGRRRSAAQMESPSPVDSVSALSLPPISRPNSREYGEEDWSSSSGPPRRILSPRSPRLHRTRSLGILGPPTGSIDAHQQPFLTTSSGRAYTVEPGNANATTPISAPPNAIRTGYFPTAPTPPPQMLMPGHRRPSGSIGPSGSASPSTSYSSIAQPGQSPATPLIHPSAATPLHTPGQTPPNVHMGLSHPNQPAHIPPLPGPAHSMEDRPMVGIPVVSAGQGNYQIITYPTKHGQVTIPVDVQAASRVADEKRKRNAGASARFRARRKEKEREASAMISKLEQEVRDANEDLEFYRRERDALAEILYNTPGGRSHFPRPQSPRRRRHSTASSVQNGPASTTGSSSSNSVTMGSGDRTERSESDRNVRRRTSSYIPSVASTAGPGLATPVHGASPNMTAMGQVPSAVHAQEDPSARTQHALPTAQPSPQRPGAQNPFLERFDRGWPPGSAPANGRDHRQP